MIWTKLSGNVAAWYEINNEALQRCKLCTDITHKVQLCNQLFVKQIKEAFTKAELSPKLVMWLRIIEYLLLTRLLSMRIVSKCLHSCLFTLERKLRFKFCSPFFREACKIAIYETQVRRQLNKIAFQWNAYRPLVDRVDRIPACTAEGVYLSGVYLLGVGVSATGVGVPARGVYPIMQWGRHTPPVKRMTDRRV